MTAERHVIVQDTREQQPLPLQQLVSELGLPFVVEVGAMPTGDYCIRGLEHRLLIERKSLADLVACVGPERGRFERELERMAEQTAWRVLLIESSESEIEAHRYRSRISPRAVRGSIAAWSRDYGLQPWLTGTREGSTRWAITMLDSVRRDVERRELKARRPISPFSQDQVREESIAIH